MYRYILKDPKRLLDWMGRDAAGRVLEHNLRLGKVTLRKETSGEWSLLLEYPPEERISNQGWKADPLYMGIERVTNDK